MPTPAGKGRPLGGIDVRSGAQSATPDIRLCAVLGPDRLADYKHHIPKPDSESTAIQNVQSNEVIRDVVLLPNHHEASGIVLPHRTIGRRQIWFSFILSGHQASTLDSYYNIAHGKTFKTTKTYL